LWVILQIPIFLVGANYLYKEIKPIPHALDRLGRVYKVFLGVIILVFAVELLFTLVNLKNYSIGKTYPVDAVEFLKNKPTKGRLFSPYNWGGYLVWNYPQKKVFIDGRMPSWRWDEIVVGESDYAMRDYKNILSGELDRKVQFEKYEIDTFLWFAPTEPGAYEKIDQYLLNLYQRLFNKEDKSFDFFKSLEDDGWEKVYEDELAVIYRTLQ
ncbi:hypothetical protein ACFL2C_03365, partial [Patescibacteria group bacterium]